MAWFGSKGDSPTPEELAAQAEAERREAAEAALRRKITFALQKDVSHQVLTVDRMQWICPYTLTLVPAAFGFVDAARDYLAEQQPFRTTRIKALPELLRHRWALHLKEQGEFEPRLRIIGPDGRWLNPFTGAWTRLPLRTGAATDDVNAAIAAVLAECPEAQDGRPMQELAVLREIESRALRAEADATNEAIAIGAVKRLSGQQHQAAQASAGDDMGRAKGILDRMLAEMPHIPGFGVAVHYEPQDDIGGDFFASLPLGSDRWLLAVADVAGHGVQGALVVVAALKALRFIVKETQDLTQILIRLNDSLKADLLQGQFLTCWMGVLHAPTRTLEHISAGHHPAAIVNARTEPLARRVMAQAPALGLLPGSAFARAVRPQTIELQPGDLLVQYTDGLSEAISPNREEFGDLRVIGSTLGVSERPYAEVVDHIASAARRFAAGAFQDDVTILVLACDPQAAEAVEA